jgi:hypothetical protein
LSSLRWFCLQESRLFIVFFAGYEYLGGIQALGWTVELFPLTFPILAETSVVFDMLVLFMRIALVYSTFLQDMSIRVVSRPLAG